MKRILLAAIAAIVLVPITLGLLMTLAGESGEVVVVTPESTDAESTRLWIIDHAGTAWLRAGHDKASWYGALVDAPAVLVERDGVTNRYQVIPRPDRRALINSSMDQKYGIAESVIGALVGGRDHAVPLQLIPAPVPTSDSVPRFIAQPTGDTPNLDI